MAHMRRIRMENAIKALENAVAELKAQDVTKLSKRIEVIELTFQGDSVATLRQDCITEATKHGKEHAKLNKAIDNITKKLERFEKKLEDKPKKKPKKER